MAPHVLFSAGRYIADCHCAGGLNKRRCISSPGWLQVRVLQVIPSWSGTVFFCF